MDNLRFHNAFLSRGGRFIWETLPDLDQMWFKHLMSGLTLNLTSIGNEFMLKPFPRVLSGFIANEYVGAAARKEGGDYFAGIYIGSVVVMRQLFLRMMTSKNVFPEIGDISKEEQTAKILNPEIFRIGRYVLAQDPEQKVVPNDLLRTQFAMHLLDLAMVFLYNHEVGHIHYGHIDFLSVGKVEILYAENDDAGNDDFLLKQTLEMDADCYATFKGISYIDYIQRNIDHFARQERLSPFLADKRRAIKYFLFAVGCLHRIFGDDKYDESDLLKKAHPPVPVRHAMIFESAWFSCQYLNLELNLEELFSLIQASIGEVEAAFSDISESEMKPTAIKFAYSPAAINHAKLLFRNWTAVRQQLMPYAFSHPRPSYELT